MVLFRKGFPIWAYLVIAIVPIVVVVSIITSQTIKMAEYKEFIIELDNSFVYSMDNDSLRAEYNGVSTRVNKKNADLIFQEVHSSGFFIIKDEVEKPKYILLDFGNGDKLWLHHHDEESVIMQYVPVVGKEKKYLTSGITQIITFERLISTGWGNTPWEDN